MQTLRIQTLGCSKNRVDSEHLLSRLESIYEISPEGETSPVDFLLLNTCGFMVTQRRSPFRPYSKPSSSRRRERQGRYMSSAAFRSVTWRICPG